TKDGVTVSKEIELEEPFENIGAKLVNAAAEKTNDGAGDGTTTAVVLAEAIYVEGLKNVVAGINPLQVKRGIDRAVEVVVEEIRKMARPVKGYEDYKHVALVSSHFDETVSELVARAMEKVGREGVMTVEEGKSLETTAEYVEGLQFDKGYISPYFVNKAEDLTAEYEDAAILLTDKKISNVPELVPLLEQVAQAGVPLVIVAEEVEGEAIAALVVNKLRGVLKVVAVKAPAFGDRRRAMLEDIAILTGGRVVAEDMGLAIDKVKLDDLGRAKRVKVEKEKCTIIGGRGDKKKVEARVAELRASIKKTTSDYDREKFEERLAKVLGGVAVIKVGGATETEMKERKYRVDDAVHAVKAAAEEGIVPGGGVTLLRAVPAVQALRLAGDEGVGARVVERALATPLWNIAANAGADASMVVEEVRSKKGATGFDARTGEFADLMQAGVVDPAKVVRLALQNAASVASMLLTSATVVAELKEKKEAAGGAVK
ncbi:MAG: chaperonin GroEL, partial [Planctomycetes bacterium]|nr:chaperonin GroEL [Planctomycetota bacterium]